MGPTSYRTWLAVAVISAKTQLLASTAVLPEPKTFVGPKDMELSGFTWIDGELIGVSDNDSEHFLYRIVFSDAHKYRSYTLEKWLNLKDLNGYATTVAARERVAKERNDPDLNRLDLEGIARCGNLIYLADERARLVHRIDRSARSISTLDLKGYPAIMWNGGPNAGIEGLAVSCKPGLTPQVAIAKERQPKFIQIFDIATGIATRLWQPSEGGDISDLSWMGDNVYALQRYDRQVAQLGPEGLQPIGSYLPYEQGLYDTNEPFGQAEAMTFKDRQLYIGWDQNNKKLSKRSTQRFHAKGVRGVIMVFDLPEALRP